LLWLFWRWGSQEVFTWAVLPISAFQVPRITRVSHRHPGELFKKEIPLEVITFVFPRVKAAFI
jgi:hypothetical protein